MAFLHLFIVNKSGSLIHHRPLSSRAPKIDINEWLRIGSTFHSLHAIAAEASPLRLPNNKNSCTYLCDFNYHSFFSNSTVRTMTFLFVLLMTFDWLVSFFAPSHSLSQMAPTMASKRFMPKDWCWAAFKLELESSSSSRTLCPPSPQTVFVVFVLVGSLTHSIPH